MCLYMQNKKIMQDTYIRLFRNRVLQRNSFCSQYIEISTFFLFCTNNLHKRTTMIKDMHINTFLENISSGILRKLIILSKVNNEKLTLNQQRTKRNCMLKKHFHQRRKNFTATIAYNNGKSYYWRHAMVSFSGIMLHTSDNIKSLADHLQSLLKNILNVQDQDLVWWENCSRRCPRCCWNNVYKLF